MPKYQHPYKQKESRGYNIGEFLDNKFSDIIDYAEDKLKTHNKNLEDETKLTLEDIRLQTRTYEANIPIVFGEMLLAGNIIWTSEVRKIVENIKESAIDHAWNIFNLASIPGLNQMYEPTKPETIIEFKIDLIIAICEGEVDDLLKVFIDGEAIDTDDYNFRFYYGSQNQKPDQLIEREKERKEDAVAFRGLCYAVFENFNLSRFGNKVPKFEFFIKRVNFGTLKSTTQSLKSKIHGINLMPGSGEFVYETSINKTYEEIFFDKEQNQLDGEVTHSNNNTSKKISDAIYGLNQMKIDLPSLKYVSVVVTWFADGLNISSASIFPASEFNDHKVASHPLDWKVAGKNRWNARCVSRREDGNLNYGGTVNDESVLNLLKELKNRGYKIIFYPMIFVDTEAKPWRGRITGEAKDIFNFFHKKEGYNNFILHYANMVKSFVHCFIIGSEMKGLTSIKDKDNNFPAVTELAKLAQSVKQIAPNIKVSYAADWSEYHSVDGFYNMDELWGSEYIDFIGIDAYFPLTHTKAKPSFKEIKNGWLSGEGYDFYFENEVKINYNKPNFAWKNIRWFLENEHINIDGTKTIFKPNTKKVWFTELGFASVDLCTNQPNVFFDPTSKESFLPLFSKGIVDMEAQKNALLASLEFIEENNDIIENTCVWCYDIRPFPFFPHNTKLWKDGELWQRGHWLNGKLGSNTFDEVVKELCVRSGW